MRKLKILTFQTLDGVMQGPGSPDEDTTGGFRHGGWAANYWGEVMEQVQREAMAEPYDLLFGRKTYEMFAPYWSSAEPDNPIAVMMNSATKYVATNTLTRVDWENSHIIRGDIPAEIAELKQKDGPLLQVHGSWRLIQSLLKHNLVDELRIWTFPVVVGSGKRLFSDTPGATYDLIKSDVCPSGAFMNFWTPKTNRQS